MNDAVDHAQGAIAGKTSRSRLATGRLIEPPSIPPQDENDPFSQMGDLVARLRFSLKEGRVWLDTHRVALVHLSTLSNLRRELIDTLGSDGARGFFARMGYTSGSRDAELARKLRPHHSLSEAFEVGPQLRRLQGAIMLEPVRHEIDVTSGHFFGESCWHESFEVDSQISAYGMASEPVCWMQIGYASGYASTFMGRPIIYKEIECRGMGHRQCRMIGKPLEAWDDIEDELRALQSEPFANRFEARRRTGKGLTKPDTAPISDELVGMSPGFVATCHLIKKVAGTQATVLFLGETGVGKAMFAKTLHRISKRAGGPFVTVDCATIPENLIEAELFGVEKGAYTGAIASRPGRFERAHGGTLFLDEIGTLSQRAQVKLLRAIHEREIERVGGTSVRRVNVRIIAATNEDLRRAVEQGRFRSDLLYRLNVFPINIPPLRERGDDIPLLMGHFLHHFNELHDRNVLGFTDKAVDALYDYDYPGNIRELENLIERAVILAEDGDPIDLCHLFSGEDRMAPSVLRLDEVGNLCQPAEIERVDDGLVDRFLAQGASLGGFEGKLLRAAVDKAGGNLAEAARTLGITRPQLAYRLKKSNGEANRSARARPA